MLKGIGLRFLLACAVVVPAFLAAGVNTTLAAAAGLALTAIILLRPLAGLALTILTNVLSPLLGKFDVSGMGLTLPRAIGMVTVASFCIWLVGRRPRVSLPRHVVPLVVFMAVTVLSVVTKPDWRQSLVGFYLLFVGVLLYVLVGILPQSRSELWLMAGMIWGMGLISSAIGFVQYVMPGFEVLQQTSGGLDVEEGAVVDAESLASGPIKRVTGGLGDANQLAYTLATVLPVGIFFWRLPGARRLRGAILAVAGLQLGALALCYSRSGVLAVLCGATYLTIRRKLAVTLVVPVALALGLAAVVLLPGFVERMSSFTYLREGSTTYRREMLGDTVAIASKHWLTGIGYGQLGPLLYGAPRSPWAVDISEYIDLESPEVHNTGAHNLLLEVWVEYGIIGLIPYLAFLVWLLRDLHPLTRSPDERINDLATALMAGLIAFMISGVFAHLKSLKVFWLLAGTTLGLRQMAARDAEGGTGARRASA